MAFDKVSLVCLMQHHVQKAVIVQKSFVLMLRLVMSLYKSALILVDTMWDMTASDTRQHAPNVGSTGSHHSVEADSQNSLFPASYEETQKARDRCSQCKP